MAIYAVLESVAKVYAGQDQVSALLLLPGIF